MSTFACPVVRVRLAPHPDADTLVIAHLGTAQAVVKQGQFQDGDLAVYLPENALLPDWLRRRLGLFHTLSAPDKHRVAARTLRGVRSHGVLMPADQYGHGLTIRLQGGPHRHVLRHGVFAEGDDAKDFLGVAEYVPATSLPHRHQMLGVHPGLTRAYTIPDINSCPDLLNDGEPVVITEAPKGAMIQLCVVPEAWASDQFFLRRIIVTTNDLAHMGVTLNPHGSDHALVNAVRKLGLLKQMARMADLAKDESLVLLGELTGLHPHDGGTLGTPRFRARDLCLVGRDGARFARESVFGSFCLQHGLRRTPTLYRGPYNKDVMLHYAQGTARVVGRIRQHAGVIVKAAGEDGAGFAPRHPKYGRKIAQFIGNAFVPRHPADAPT